MEELFRFLLARPAEKAGPDRRPVDVPLSADYRSRLEAALGADEPRIAARKVARAFRQSASMPGSVAALTSAAPLQALCDRLAKTPLASLADLDSLIRAAFGAGAADVVANPGHARDRERLGDVLVTNAVLGRDGSLASFEAARLLRTMTVIERAAAGDGTLATPGGLAEAMERTLLLPGAIFPLAGGRAMAAAPSPGPSGELPQERRRRLLERRRDLFAAYVALTRVVPDDLAVPVVRPRRLVRRERRAETALSEALQGGGVKAGWGTPPRNALLLKAEAVAGFSQPVRAVLAERRMDLAALDLPVAAEQLSCELRAIDLELVELQPAAHIGMTALGSLLEPSGIARVGTIVAGGFFPLVPTVPETHAVVASPGIGDLLVVKQSLKRYEARELAHIENILKGENKDRMHRRARTTEETITVETEEKREEERDLQTTERFELKTESEQVQKEDSSLKVGVAITGKYGPFIEVKASTDYALNQSKEESTRLATDYSKEVTNRAVGKLSERRREERILKTIEVFEETNTHGVDNKAGADHVVGQYQWIDKISEAQVFNYGKRMLFDVMVPEPGAFWLFASDRNQKSELDLSKPLPFTLKPSEISEWNYDEYVRQYEALGVSPPPAPYVTASKSVDGKGDDGREATKAMELPVPTGYEAIRAIASVFFVDSGGTQVAVTIGDQMRLFETNSDGWLIPMRLETGSVPLTVLTSNSSVFTVAVEIDCRRTQRALDAWKQAVHTAILQAYQKQLRDYEEKLAARQVEAGQKIQGRNPGENERLIRTELKKNAISVFTLQHYDLFGAIIAGAEGYPHPDLLEAEAEGRYIRFFEQAFEWEQMMFFFYPYFWGRKPNWVNRALLQDTDPLFADFIKAGAARLVLPVRPGFEQAITHFLDTGEIWNGGDLPNLTSPLYVSIIEEIRERDRAPGSEIAQGDPWDVRLPTTLVRIRPEVSLPSWRKDTGGEWVPA